MNYLAAEMRGINDEKLTPAASRLPLSFKERGRGVSSGKDGWSVVESRIETGFKPVSIRRGILLIRNEYALLNMFVEL